MDVSLYEDSFASAQDSRRSCELPHIEIAFFIPGVILFILGLVDMIVLYVVPTNIANRNKRELPYAQFEKPKTAIIVFHFLEHIFLMILGIVFIIMSFIDFDDLWKILAPVIPGVLFFVCYIVLAVYGSKTRSYKSQNTIEQMTEKLAIDNPIEFIFIYTEGEEQSESCQTDSDGHRKCTHKTNTCYSKKGVKFPVSSQRKTEPYNFTNTPDLLYFNYHQILSKSADLAACLSDVVNQIDSCKRTIYDYNVYNAKRIQENYPVQEGTYIISRKKLPSPMSKASRICCILFGTTAFYEIYTKSIPYVNFDQNVDVNLITGNRCPSIDIKCDDYAACKKYSKPKP